MRQFLHMPLQKVQRSVLLLSAQFLVAMGYSIQVYVCVCVVAIKGIRTGDCLWLFSKDLSKEIN